MCGACGCDIDLVCFVVASVVGTCWCSVFRWFKCVSCLVFCGVCVCLYSAQLLSRCISDWQTNVVIGNDYGFMLDAHACLLHRPRFSQVMAMPAIKKRPSSVLVETLHELKPEVRNPQDAVPVASLPSSPQPVVPNNALRTEVPRLRALAVQIWSLPDS